MEWDGYQDWHLVLPPSRPSQEELQRIAAALSTHRRGIKIAVLGATPEYRDLLARLGFYSVTVIDKNPMFVKRISAYCPNARSEQFIYDDWISALHKIPRNFDVILSHLTSGNVPFFQRDQFYAGIANSLIPGGLYIDTMLLHRQGFHDPARLLSNYQNQPINISVVNNFNCEFVFCSTLVSDTKMVRPDEAYAFAIAHSKSPSIKTIVEICQKITPPSGRWYYGRTADVELEIVERHLKIIQEFDQVANGPYLGMAFQIFMTTMADGSYE